MADSQGSPSIDPSRLRVEPFRETQTVHGFTCGNKTLDEFLTLAEVQQYERAGLGRTFLVFYDDELVAYYTLSNAALRTEYL